MTNDKSNNLVLNGWRRLLLHPLFFEGATYAYLGILAIALYGLYWANPFSSIILISSAVSFLIAVYGLILSIYEKKTTGLTHLALVINLSYPTLCILFLEGDLRLAIFALPGAYLLQLALMCHKLKRGIYAAYNGLLLFWLLLPMISSNIRIYNESHGMQMMLLVILSLTTLILFIMYLWHRTRWFLLLNEKRLVNKIDSIIQVFSGILVKNDHIDRVLQNVAHNVIPNLEFEDCVIYLVDDERQVLVQKAAFGSKNSETTNDIVDPIDIPVGRGIVGSVASSGKPEIIHDTTKDTRYIQDDAQRFSELAVPIAVNNKVVGVIDSEHSSKNFFNEVHLYMLQIIASLCASKIIEIENRTIYAQSAKLEIESKKLHEINAVKTRFIANLSHDLKTPLTLILGPSNQLLKQKLTNRDKELATLINDNGKKLKQIIDELLLLNEMAFLSQNAKPKMLDFGLLMNSWKRKFEERCNRKNIDLKVSGEGSIKMELDEKKLTTVIFSLFDNALKFTPDNGQIHIKYALTKKCLVWEIHDSGPGISPDKKASIFDSAGEKKQTPATGLAFAKALMDSMDSEIKLIDSKLGGAGFQLHVNCLSKDKNGEPEQVAPFVEQPVFTRKENPVVLVIEDHDDLRQFIQTSVEDEFICVSAETGEKGLELAKKFVPDLIITDLMLPGISGETVCKTLNEDIRLNHVPIIVLSAKSMTLDRVELYQLGAENYLTKPFEIAELKAIIHNTLQQRVNLRMQFKSNFSEQSGDAADPFLENVISLIHQHIADQDFNVKKLIELTETGRNQLQRKIKMLTDMTPVEFIRHIRLKAAHDLLTQSSLSVSEVAYKTGFNNLSYFTRTFKRTFGNLPSEIRDKQLTLNQTNVGNS